VAHHISTPQARQQPRVFLWVQLLRTALTPEAAVLAARTHQARFHPFNHPCDGTTAAAPSTYKAALAQVARHPSSRSTHKAQPPSEAAAACRAGKPSLTAPVAMHPLSPRRNRPRPMISDAAPPHPLTRANNAHVLPYRGPKTRCTP